MKFEIKNMKVGIEKELRYEQGKCHNLRNESYWIYRKVSTRAHLPHKHFDLSQ